MGDNFPIGDNNIEEGRGRNRRIEVIAEVTDVIPDSTVKPEEVFNQLS